MVEIKVRRFKSNPIIYPDLDPSIGSNIAGPSLIRVPSWSVNPLGKYYLYFAGHKGKFIRLAYTNQLEGPWEIYKKGSLHIEESHFPTEPPEEKIRSDIRDENVPHIASPDVHVNEYTKEFRMYFHGLESKGRQLTRYALSTDGIHFKTNPEVLIPPYLRVFYFNGFYYGMCMPGMFYRSLNSLHHFERGPRIFPVTMRHSALRISDKTLQVFWTNVGDSPERILLSCINLAEDWSSWKPSAPIEVMRPVKDWEGGNFDTIPSERGPIYDKVCQLRNRFVIFGKNFNK